MACWRAFIRCMGGVVWFSMVGEGCFDMDLVWLNLSL